MTYESVIILSPQLDEEALENAINRIQDVIKNGNGEVTKVDRWGKRRLAYEIKDLTEGYYLLVEMDAPSATAQELDRVLRISDDVIRHLIVRRNT
ncbi:30S ribosomal protein S6 [Capillibacterium thermochitinicola]|uniref:Small ribosomal subunit protein bS6 n=1 Tax=Capillibacterium thermochitinicola TaxID=2699427 RepID=A0A8J6I164_9FIRM|nr:30S ribosomal protein S6 [Capillibacterium thermochitinicola]MBA2133088.1 30S ribosomal protein S6 [Capillibacterium thermochitinicola]